MQMHWDFYVYSQIISMHNKTSLKSLGYIFPLHLADAFIQSDSQSIQATHFYFHYMCSLGIEPTTFCTANAMPLSHRDTIFVAIAKNTLYGWELYIFILCQKSLWYEDILYREYIKT